ncbi:hypothetical protein EU528_11995 [Candidatus Thorarchaeota archaeon]|nr:MAG: hypothetical protein EU528_11995 [Candidatus Thorarchaeota archaeon]
MPTWCDCDLTLKTDSPQDIRHFIEFNKKKNPNKILDAESFLPTPSNDAIDPKEWMVSKWGTRSNLEEVVEILDYKEGMDKHQYSFRTIGTPPKPVIRTMSEMFHSIIFILEFYEKIEGFRGMSKFQNGVMLHDEVGEYYGKRGGIA